MALVVGATGVTGTPLVETLLERGWSVRAVSRRTPQFRAGVDTTKLAHLALDVTDSAKTRAVLGGEHAVTHVFYCGNDARPDVRLRMLRNVLEGIAPAARRLVNVHLLQGTKYYGCHLGPFKVPARESDARISGADFYYGEEDYVRTLQAGERWTWTALRPHAVCGYAAGNPVNLATVIGIYGALCKALGRPFAFPASPICFDKRYNVMDAELLARAALWCATTARCGNEAFNINNGDIFRWQELWPRLARALDLEAAGPQAQPLHEFLDEHAGLWIRLTQRHGLKPFPYERLAHWVQGDYSAPSSRLACAYDCDADLSKARRYGFDEQIDSLQMFERLFARLRHERVIP
jgi:nucleoside-diphosphate-sugar epimerase